MDNDLKNKIFDAGREMLLSGGFSPLLFVTTPDRHVHVFDFTSLPAVDIVTLPTIIENIVNAIHVAEIALLMDTYLYEVPGDVTDIKNIKKEEYDRHEALLLITKDPAGIEKSFYVKYYREEGTISFRTMEVKEEISPIYNRFFDNIFIPPSSELH